MASTILDPVAEALKDVVETTLGLNAVKWTPKDVNPPTAVIGIPRGHRSGVDEAEQQLGSEDWYLTYTVAMFFDLSEAQHSQAQAVEMVEALISAIDDNPSLANTVLDAKVTNFEPEVVTTANRPLLSYSVDVEVLKLV